MQARQHRRTWWIVGTLVVLAGIGVALATTDQILGAPPGWEIVPAKVTPGLSRADPFTARVVTLVVEDGELRIAPGSQVAADVPAGHALVLDRRTIARGVRPERADVDVAAGPRLAVDAPAIRTTVELRAEMSLHHEKILLETRVRNEAGDGPHLEGGSIYVDEGDVAVDLLPCVGVPAQFGCLPPHVRAPPALRDALVLWQIGTQGIADGAWTIDDWRAAVRTDIDGLAIESARLASRPRREWFQQQCYAIARVAMLAAVLQVKDALPALQELAEIPRRTRDHVDVRAVVHSARRALGDPSLPASGSGEPFRTLGSNLADRHCFALIARTTDDPDVAAWAVEAALRHDVPPRVARELLAAHAAGRLALSEESLTELRRVRPAPPTPQPLRDVSSAVLGTGILAVFLALVVFAERRRRRGYVTRSADIALLIATLVVAGLDVPPPPGVLSLSPLALLAAAWLVHRLGGEFPAGGTRRVALALAAAAGLWVAGRWADSAAIEALGRALEFAALLLLLRAARAAEPAALALRDAPARSAPRWTAPVPYAVLAGLAGLVIIGEIDPLSPAGLVQRLREPARVALPCAAAFAVGVGIWLGTTAHSPRESPPVVRTALGIWLATLHVAAVVAALFADGIDLRAADAVRATGSAAAVLFTLLACLRFDAVLIDRALHHARSRMIRAVRETDDAAAVRDT